MKEIISAILSDEATSRDFEALRLPDHYTGVLVRSEDVGIFEDMESADKDPRRSLRIEEVPTPRLEAGEAFVGKHSGHRQDSARPPYPAAIGE